MACGLRDFVAGALALAVLTLPGKYPALRAAGAEAR